MKFTDPLKKNKEFNSVFKKGKFYVGSIMVIYVMPNKADRNRLGVTTVRNFGTAVLRNRCRRLIKENYRLLEDRIAKGYDIIFTVRKLNGSAPSFYEVRREMLYLLKKMGILLNKEEKPDNEEVK